MKYPVLLMAVALFVSFVVSETLRSDLNLASLSQDSINGNIRARRTAAPPAAVQPAVEHINYRPYSEVPSNIKQLLQFQQAREPITHIAAQPPPQLARAQIPARAQYNPQIQHAAQSQAQSHPQYQSQPQANYQQQQSPVYRQNPQQAQPGYNPHQHQQQPGNVFNPEQRRQY